MTKILFYYEISHFADGVSSGLSYGLLKSHLLEFFGNAALRTGEYDVKSIVSEAANHANAQTHGLDIIKPIAIKDEDYLAIAPRGTTFRALYQKFFFSELSASEEALFSALIREKLGNWQPDIIIAFPIHNTYLQRLYPAALFLSTENGMFSRAPFPRTIRFEPFHYIHNFTNHFSNEIRCLAIPPEVNVKVQRFRDSVIKAVEEHNPFTESLKNLKTRFRKLILLPVIWGQNIYRESSDNDEVAFLINTLKEIPADIGVIATFHDGPASQLNPGVLAHIKRNHPNLITESDLGKRTSGSSPSLYFFNHVDAVLNCMTGTGLQACLWPTRIIAIDKHYSHWFADNVGMEDLNSKLSAPVRNRNAMIHWYLTHCVLWEKHFNDGTWLNSYFKTLLKTFKSNGIDFRFFHQCDDFDALASYTLRHIQKSYSRARVFDIVPPPLMLVASKIKSFLLQHK